MPAMANHLLSFGHGYSAQALSKLLLPMGWKITATTRDPAKLDLLRNNGVKPVLWDSSDVKSAINDATALLISASPDENGDPVLDENGDQVVTLGVKSVLKAQEKATAGSLLARYDWYVVRKAEKSTAIPTAITTYRDGVRTACNTRETEIDACADTAALVTLYSFKEDGTAYMLSLIHISEPTRPERISVGLMCL